MQKKIEKFPSKVEKKLETTNFSKTSILSKCFSRHIECSIGNPHSHTHTPTHTPKHFSPEDPKLFSRSPRLKIKLIIFEKFFFLKNFSWTNKLQFRQLHPFFRRMLESFYPKIRPVVKSWDFYQKKLFLPISLCRTRNGRFDNPSETFLPKMEIILFKVRERYDIVNIWKKSLKFFLQT